MHTAYITTVAYSMTQWYTQYLLLYSKAVYLHDYMSTFVLFTVDTYTKVRDNFGMVSCQNFVIKA